MSERSRPSIALASSAVALAAFLFRLAAFNGFENDHFMHVAWAQQLLAGDWPGRDFVEPGMPLVVVLSAAAQLLWPGFLSEAVLGIGMVALAAGFCCAVAAHLTRSIAAGVAAGVVVAASYPRLYSYPKLLVPAVALWLLLRYLRTPSVRGPWTLSGWTVAAFLLRHDLGLATAAAVGLALAVDPSRRLSARAVAIGQYAGMGLLLVAPYLVYVQATEGVAEHVRVGVEFGKAERHQVLWELPSLVPGGGDLALAFGSWSVSPEAVLFLLYSAFLVLLAGVVVAHRRERDLPALAALWVFLVVFRVVILRHPLRARLPDVAVVAALAAVVVGVAAARKVPLWWRPRPVRAVATAMALAIVAAGAAASLWTVVNLSDRLAQADIHRGPAGVLAAARNVVRRGMARSWEPYWPAGDIPPIVDYLARCTRPGDRLLVTWFAPEYYLFAGRPFAAGQSQFFKESFATERDQDVMLERLRRQTVPFALVNEADHAEFERAFPRVARFIADGYAVRARFARDDEGSTIAIAVRKDLHPRTTFGDPPWMCGYD